MVKYRPCSYCKKKPRAYKCSTGDWHLDHDCSTPRGKLYLGGWTLQDVARMWNGAHVYYEVHKPNRPCGCRECQEVARLNQEAADKYCTHGLIDDDGTCKFCQNKVGDPDV